MSSAQAGEFASRFRVVTQFNDTATSFSATVFADASGNLTLAIRGTLELIGTPNDLYPTDLDILGRGAGYDQIVAMVNWWQRASTASGQVAQYALVEYPNAQSVLPPADALRLYQTELAFGGRYLYLVRAADAAASGELVAARGADADGRLDVTGHSLGSHLALAFNTMFSSQVGQVVGFNGPGFIDTPTNRDFFTQLGGALPVEANSANVTNVKADESSVGQQPWRAVAGLHSRPGVDVNVAIEDQWLSDEPSPTTGSWNHSQMVLTDSLAVYALLAQLDPALSTSNYKSLLGGAALGTAASYERTVDALQRLLNVDNTLLPAGNQAANRDAMYQAIYGLRGNATYTALAGQVRIEPTHQWLATVGARDPLWWPDSFDPQPRGWAAQNDFAALLSLTKGATFSLRLNDPSPASPASLALYGVHRSEYERWLADRNVRAADANAEHRGSLNYSTTYLAARAAFLNGVIAANTADDAVGYVYSPSISRTITFTDIVNPSDASQNRSLILRPTNTSSGEQQRVVFGSSGNDSIYGESRDERLSGVNTPNEFLFGGGGNDYIYGGSEMDVILGGAGDDTLVEESGPLSGGNLFGGFGYDTYAVARGATQNGICDDGTDSPRPKGLHRRFRDIRPIGIARTLA